MKYIQTWVRLLRAPETRHSMLCTGSWNMCDPVHLCTCMCVKVFVPLRLHVMRHWLGWKIASESIVSCDVRLIIFYIFLSFFFVCLLTGLSKSYKLTLGRQALGLQRSYNFTTLCGTGVKNLTCILLQLPLPVATQTTCRITSQPTTPFPSKTLQCATFFQRSTLPHTLFPPLPLTLSVFVLLKRVRHFSSAKRLCFLILHFA